MNAPKISVIIPMYNAAKFIRQCLISVLASKFNDYEVIVVDDCSTDDSVAEVEKLLPHFDGRLRLLATEKNSDGGGVPRNIGISHAAGKYITFLDADDMILPTALGNFVETAEKFHADVVHTERFFVFSDTGLNNFKREDLILRKQDSGKCVEGPMLESELSERIERYTEGEFFWVPWGKFFRRDFLLENGIDFPQIKFSEDMVFCFKCLCLAKNYLRVPFVTNIYRITVRSNSQKNYSFKEWLAVLAEIVADVDKFMRGFEFFQHEPSYRHKILKFITDKHLSFNKNILRAAEPHVVQEFFYEAFQSAEINERGKNLIAAYLYAERAMNQTR